MIKVGVFGGKEEQKRKERRELSRKMGEKKQRRKGVEVREGRSSGGSR